MEVSQDFLVTTDRLSALLAPQVLKIRRALPQDVCVLYQAAREISKTPGVLLLLPHEFGEAEFRDKLQWIGKAGICLVAECDGKLLGHAWLDPMPLSVVAHVFSLSLLVHPDQHGCGIANDLLTALTDWAAQAGRVEKIEWRIREQNHAARQQAKCFGFIEEGRFARSLKLPNGSYLSDIALAKFY